MENTVHLGDCLEIMGKIPSRSVDLILTDIPYDAVSKNGYERAKYSGQKRNINKEEADVLTFALNLFIQECERISRGSIYIFCSIEQTETIHSYFKYEKSKDWMARHCIWHKSNPSPSNGEHFFLNAFENIVFAKRRKTTYNAHCRHNIFNSFAGKSNLHPTQKPVSLFEEIIKISSNEGDIVLDPCAGSGTTAIACKNTNRKYILIEKEEKYFEIINNRISEALKEDDQLILFKDLSNQHIKTN